MPSGIQIVDLEKIVQSLENTLLGYVSQYPEDPDPGWEQAKRFAKLYGFTDQYISYTFEVLKQKNLPDYKLSTIINALIARMREMNHLVKK